MVTMVGAVVAVWLFDIWVPFGIILPFLQCFSSYYQSTSTLFLTCSFFPLGFVYSRQSLSLEALHLLRFLAMQD